VGRVVWRVVVEKLLVKGQSGVLACRRPPSYWFGKCAACAMSIAGGIGDDIATTHIGTHCHSHHNAVLPLPTNGPLHLSPNYHRHPSSVRQVRPPTLSWPSNPSDPPSQISIHTLPPAHTTCATHIHTYKRNCYGYTIFQPPTANTTQRTLGASPRCEERYIQPFAYCTEKKTRLPIET